MSSRLGCRFCATSFPLVPVWLAFYCAYPRLRPPGDPQPTSEANCVFSPLDHIITRTV